MKTVGFVQLSVSKEILVSSKGFKNENFPTRVMFLNILSRACLHFTVYHFHFGVTELEYFLIIAFSTHINITFP